MLTGAKSILAKFSLKSERGCSSFEENLIALIKPSICEKKKVSNDKLQNKILNILIV